MSKKRKNKATQQAATPQDTTPIVDATKVRIANGAGRKAIVVDYIDGETFNELFARTGVKPEENQIVTYGKKQVRDFKGLVEPGTTITIANQPNNG